MEVDGIGGRFKYDLSVKYNIYLLFRRKNKQSKNKESKGDLILVKYFNRIIAIGVMLSNKKLVQENPTLYKALMNDEDEQLFCGIDKESLINLYYTPAEWFHLENSADKGFLNWIKERQLMGIIKLWSLLSVLPKNSFGNSVLELFLKGLRWYLRRECGKI
jgi:hypothetical protein